MEIKIEFFQENLIKAIGAGIYEISVEKNEEQVALYIGESVFVLVRCAAHLYELKKNPNYFGFTENTIKNADVILKFGLIEDDNDKLSRKRKEIEYIIDKKPISQSGIGDRQKSVADKIKALNHFLNRKETN